MATDPLKHGGRRDTKGGDPHKYGPRPAQKWRPESPQGRFSSQHCRETRRLRKTPTLLGHMPGDAWL